jgi:putative cell wall-binding protein
VPTNLTRGRFATAAAASVLALSAAVIGIETPAFAATAVTNVSVSPSPATVGANATYTVGFTSTTGITAGDTIEIASISTNTMFPLSAGDYAANTTAPTSVTEIDAQDVVLHFASGLAVAAGGAVSVVAMNVTNPTTAGTNDELEVSTTSDSTQTFSAPYAITAATTAVSGVTAVVSPLTASVVATYTIGFVSTTALVIGDTITLVAPSGTTFPTAMADYTVKAGAGVATELTAAPTGGGATVTIATPVAVTAGVAVQVVATPGGNPAAGVDSLTVKTSKDLTAIASNTYTIGAIASQITALLVSTTPAVAGSVSSYAISFTTTTALAIGDKITLVGPAGTIFQTGTVDYTIQGLPVTALPTQVSAANITITTPVAILAAATVTIAASHVINPIAAIYTLTASTTRDVTTATSATYSIVAATTSVPGTTVPDAPVRLAGTDRFGTAIATSAIEFPIAGSAQAVVVARSDQYADALVGITLAAEKDGPLLFANGGTLTAATEAEITRVLPAGGTIYLLGGTAAVPTSVATTLTTMGYVTVRYAGSDRYGTAIAVADALGDPTTVLLATGINFPDALSAGPAAAHVGGVVLLTYGTVLPAVDRAYLTAHPGTDYAIGGPAVAADPSASALSGSDRYATAAAVATSLFAGPTDVGVASGVVFPDALSGGAFEARSGGPILLSDPSALSPATGVYLTSVKAKVINTTMFGGTSALSATVQASVSTSLGL